MSVQKWHQLAEEKSAVDQQTQDIHQKFRKTKLTKSLVSFQEKSFLNQSQKGFMKRAAPL